MAEDWSLDVRRYVPDADQGVIDAIVRYCGIALQKRDSSFISFNEREEIDRVRENFLKKKLGLTHPDPELDSAILAVGERMKGDRAKNRVTVYYLLAERFNKLGLFGGREGAGVTPRAASAADMGVAASAVAGAKDRYAEDHGERITRVEPTARGFAERPGAAAAAAAGPAEGGVMRWLPWLILAIALLALLWWLFAGRQPTATVATTEPTPAPAPMGQAPAGTAATAGAPAGAATAPGVNGATGVAGATGAMGTPGAMGVNGAAGAIGSTGAPGAAGATAAGGPAKVFFANDSAAISADGAQVIRNAAARLKTEGGKIAITAFTDRTGDPAHNQELAKNRAVAVRDALVAAGAPQGSIEMRPPATVETGTAGKVDAEARRVEITRG